MDYSESAAFPTGQSGSLNLKISKFRRIDHDENISTISQQNSFEILPYCIDLTLTCKIILFIS